MEALLEQLQGLTTKLSSLSIEQLEQVCGQLELETDDLADKVNGRLRLVRRVLNHVNSEEVQDSDDGEWRFFRLCAPLSKE